MEGPPGLISMSKLPLIFTPRVGYNRIYLVLRIIITYKYGIYWNNFLVEQGKGCPAAPHVGVAIQYKLVVS